MSEPKAYSQFFFLQKRDKRGCQGQMRTRLRLSPGQIQEEKNGKGMNEQASHCRGQRRRVLRLVWSDVIMRAGVGGAALMSAHQMSNTVPGRVTGACQPPAW